MDHAIWLKLIVCAGILAALWNRVYGGQDERWRIVWQALRDGLMKKIGKRE